MNRKLIFLDIDGTLVEPGMNEPPASALKAIEKARSCGHKIFLCSGRNRGMLSPLLCYDWDGYIGSSGGYVVSDNKVIYNEPLTLEQRDLVMGTLKSNGIYRTIECLDNSYTDESFKDFLREHASEGGNSELLRWREQVESALNILPMASYQGEPCYKVVIMIPDAGCLEEPMRLLDQEFQFVIQEGNQAGFLNGEIVSRRYNKGTGIRLAADTLGIPIEDTIGVGDSMNDLEMFETVGFSVCMGNGAQKMQDMADLVCPAVSEDGIYRAFEQLGLF